MPVTAKDALLVIDVQNDFCPGGALAVGDGDAVVDVINPLIEQFSTVVITQDWHPAAHQSFASQHAGAEPFSTTQMPYGEQTLWPDHCIQGTSGAEFHSRLNTDAGSIIIRKGMRASVDSYSAFFENDKSTTTGLSGYLREAGIERVYCCGLAYDFCVRFSAEDARRQGFETVVLTDACRAIDMDGSAEAASTAMRAAGIELTTPNNLG